MSTNQVERFKLEDLPWRHRVKVNEKGCWICNGFLLSGYAKVSINGKQVRAHRASYLHFIGSIPQGLVLDHLCRNRACVNPTHLEAVTDGENIRRGFAPSAQHARKTHCYKGHPFSGANLETFQLSSGQPVRRCRKCKAAHMKKYRSNRRKILREQSN